MSREYIIKVLDDEEMKPQFTQDGNVYKATMPIPYENMGELIRCKECKWFNTKFGQCEGELNRYIHTDGSTEFTVFEPEPDFYCPFGKRKEE